MLIKLILHLHPVCCLWDMEAPFISTSSLHPWSTKKLSLSDPPKNPPRTLVTGWQYIRQLDCYRHLGFRRHVFFFFGNSTTQWSGDSMAAHPVIERLQNQGCFFLTYIYCIYSTDILLLVQILIIPLQTTLSLIICMSNFQKKKL